MVLRKKAAAKTTTVRARSRTGDSLDPWDWDLFSSVPRQKSGLFPQGKPCLTAEVANTRIFLEPKMSKGMRLAQTVVLVLASISELIKAYQCLPQGNESSHLDPEALSCGGVRRGEEREVLIVISWASTPEKRGRSEDILSFFLHSCCLFPRFQRDP